MWGVVLIQHNKYHSDQTMKLSFCATFSPNEAMFDLFSSVFAEWEAQAAQIDEINTNNAKR